jgi:hypothetical protein
VRKFLDFLIRQNFRLFLKHYLRGTLEHSSNIKRIFFRGAIVSFCLLFFSCAKDDNEPDPAVPVNPGVFIWQIGSNTAVNADSAFFYQQFNTIYAFKNGNSNSLEINLSALSVGNYSFSLGSENVFTYANGSSSFVAKSGTLRITAAAGVKLSGDFNVSFDGGPVTLNGSFIDIVRK